MADEVASAALSSSQKAIEVMRSNERDNPLDTFEDIDMRILAQLRCMTHTEKDRLLKHLKLENALKINNSK